MRIFLAGATGAIGRPLVPMLVADGHTVIGTSRGHAHDDTLRARGAEPVTMDGLDRAEVLAVVGAAEPDVVIHQMSGLAGSSGDLRRFDEDFAATNDLRLAGTDNLLEAAREAGAKRFIAASYTGWPQARTGAPVHDESAPLDADPAPESHRTLAAIKHTEAAVTGARDIDALVLRYGMFYGPGTGLARDGDLLAMIRARKLPVVGGGGGVWSFVHIADAARATALAVGRGRPGIYHVTDSDPAPVAVWLPYLHRLLGVRPPRRVPAWLARPILGRHGLNMMTSTRGADNTLARTELGWVPDHPSWRDGFRTLTD
ncbi:NAD(P)-dependent oxidoreductase [Occultella glacieicola]|uniref:NAD(P)-dependent oxidoreductase n=1 Tax=Occultella glacieicola TaxID=2518684 RepID=A0ABY2EA80_9MICO|nr:NAD(P)-dependent oxidoreductase [Occultella glacieicola]TDE95770.1 NAD(P)-dependent oxidoreductase [Occultella glacieicola]